MTRGEILQLETDVQKLLHEINSAALRIPDTADANRDCAGTLHVNLCALRERINRATKALRARFDFQEGR